MASFALVENGIVVQVISVKDCAIGGCIGSNDPDYLADPEAHTHCGTLSYPDTEPLGQQFLKGLGLDGKFIQTSYNGNFRGAYAGIGYAFDAELDEFVSPVVQSADTAE